MINVTLLTNTLKEINCLRNQNDDVWRKGEWKFKDEKGQIREEDV